jgi:hypothetical protein
MKKQYKGLLVICAGTILIKLSHILNSGQVKGLEVDPITR